MGMGQFKILQSLLFLLRFSVFCLFVFSDDIVLVVAESMNGGRVVAVTEGQPRGAAGSAGVAKARRWHGGRPQRAGAARGAAGRSGPHAGSARGKTAFLTQNPGGSRSEQGRRPRGEPPRGLGPGRSISVPLTCVKQP